MNNLYIKQLLILKIKARIQTIKTTETRGMIVLQHSSVRKSLLWHFIRYFFNAKLGIELCCNTIIPLVSVVFIAWIPTLLGASLSEPHTSEILENIPYLVVRTFDSVTDSGR